MSEGKRVEVRLEHDRRVLRLRLASPPGNILGMAMMEELGDRLEEHAEEHQLALVVFDGKGDHFSYGASVQEHRRAEVEKMLAAFRRLVDRIVATSLPTAALVRGRCLGGGLELAALCDFLLCDATAQFAVPEIKLGIFPPVACALLPHRIGTARASSLVLSGRTLDAKEAVAIGLVDKCWPDGFLEEGFDPWVVQNVLRQSSSSLRIATRAARLPWIDRFREDVAKLEALYLEELVPTADANEGLAAFLEKRHPVWTHGRIK